MRVKTCLKVTALLVRTLPLSRLPLPILALGMPFMHANCTSTHVGCALLVQFGDRPKHR
jgi:hypothetical protein